MKNRRDVNCKIASKLLFPVKNLANYVEKSPKEVERDLLRLRLFDFIDINHELVLLAVKIDRTYFEHRFASNSSDLRINTNVERHRMQDNISFLTIAKLAKQVIDCGRRKVANSGIRK